MPRSGGRSGGGRAGGRAPSRPTAAPAKPAPQQTRTATTAAHPPAGTRQPQQQAPGGSGLFGQMASTAAGVAVGSSIGHAVGGWFGGGSSATEQPQQSGAVAAQDGDSMQQSSFRGAGSCDVDARNFTNCMDEHNGNMQICGWYMQQLKACQQAASQY